MDRRHDQAEDLEQRTLGRILARHDIEKCLALFRRGALVDDRLHLAIAFMQRARKINGCRENQTIERGTLEVSLGNLHADHAFARSVSRRGVEIAGTTKRAIAVLDPFAFETPVRCSHGTPPIALSGWTMQPLDNPFQRQKVRGNRDLDSICIAPRSNEADQDRYLLS